MLNATFQCSLLLHFFSHFSFIISIYICLFYRYMFYKSYSMCHLVQCVIWIIWIWTCLFAPCSLRATEKRKAWKEWREKGGKGQQVKRWKLWALCFFHPYQFSLCSPLFLHFCLSGTCLCHKHFPVHLLLSSELDITSVVPFLSAPNPTPVLHPLCLTGNKMEGFLASLMK